MPKTKLGDWSPGDRSTLAGPDTGEEDDPACDCSELPDDVECWMCVHRRIRA